MQFTNMKEIVYQVPLWLPYELLLSV